MSEPPDYVVNVPSTQDVHTEPPKSSAWTNLSQNQLRGLRDRLVESIIQTVTQAITGLFTPGGGVGGAFDQLNNWASNIRADANDALDGLLNAFNLPDMDDLLNDVDAAWTNAIETRIKPLNLLADLVDGLVPDFQIPSLDASKIATGAFDQGRLNIPNVQQIVDNIVQGGGVGSGVGNAVDDVLDSIGGIFSTANRADQNIIDVQASVQQLIDENSAGVVGNKNSVTFSGAEGSTLSGFTVGPDFDSIVIRDIDDSTVTAGIKSGLGDGRYWAVFDTTQYATDDQSVSAVFGKHGSEEISTTLTNRTDPTMTNGAFCNVRKDRVSVGYFTRSGSTFTFTELAAISRTTNIGARVELRSEGTNYRVLINSVQVLAITDTGNHVTIGSTNRSCGFTLARDTLGLFNTVHYSFWLASFAMSDYAPGGIAAVPSWHLTRSSTSSVERSISNGATGVLPSGFLTLQDSAVGATVTDLGLGVVRIDEAGWYEIEAAAIAKPSDNTDHRIAFWFVPHWALYKNGAQFTGPLTMGVPKKVYLAANDTVQMALVAASTTPTAGENEETDASTTLAGVPIDIAWIKGFASFSGKLVA